MKKSAVLLSLALASVLSTGTPAFAQFGKLGDLAKGAQKAKSVADLKVTDKEEHDIGKQVSDKIVQEFGVYQDANVTKYVTLLGTVLAQASPRPGLDWQFIVLDTEGVNAFAAPGGYVHITKGLLGLLKNESELACVLSHELTHVTEKHTVNAIQKSDTVKLGSTSLSGSGGMTAGLIADFAQKAYQNILDNKFSRTDENEADEKGVQLANKVGYSPAGLTNALNKIADRNKNATEPNGLFASHPMMKDRLANIDRTIREKKLTATATVQARYAKNISFDAKPVTAISMVAAGSRGLTGGDKNKAADAGKKPAEGEKPADGAKKDEPAKGSGGMLSKLRPGGGTQAQQSQTVASAGGRAISPDRDAVGGANKNRVPVKIGPNDVAEFQKGIA